MSELGFQALIRLLIEKGVLVESDAGRYDELCQELIKENGLEALYEIDLKNTPKGMN